MKSQILKEFSKHYKRLEEDLSQINGFTPVMKKIISINFKNLENDVIYKIEGRENAKRTCY